MTTLTGMTDQQERRADIAAQIVGYAAALCATRAQVAASALIDLEKLIARYDATFDQLPADKEAA